MNIRELSQELGIKEESLQRNLRRWAAQPAKAFIFERAGADPYGLDTGLNAELPAGLADSIRDFYREDKNGAPPAPAPDKPSPPRPAPKPKPAPSRRQPGGANIIHNDTSALIFGAILIAADGMSCAWIAYNTYGDAKYMAGLIFAFAGVAIGYAAFRNVTSYKGYEESSFAWAFGVFQFVLHLCAMQTLDFIHPGISHLVGKVVISIGLPLSTAGIAYTLKQTA